MKKYLLIFCFLTINFSLNAQFSDDFSDGDFTENPQWNGTTEKFAVNNFELQLNDVSASGTGSFKAYLSTNSTAILNASWECKIRANVNLTTANYVRFYLVSDNADFTAPLNGYFIAVGGTTAKEISLYRQNGTATTKIIDGADNRVTSSTSNVLNVKAQRDEAGNWQLFSKLDTETDFVLEGEIFDNFSLNAQFSAIYINYSSGNKDKYFFDDFLVSGEPYIFIPQTINCNDLIINEIMADPDPQVGLPNFEYIELFNRTDRNINLAGWKISVGNNTGTITQGEISAGSFLLLCSSAARSELLQFGNVAQITSFSTLPNSAGLITLKTAENQTVAFIEYSDKWFGGDNFKKDGGFSLEKIDPENLHNSADNWQPSRDNSGGTPCRQNSVFAENSDKILPKFLYVSLPSDTSVILFFNKELNDSVLSDIQNYYSENINIISATAESPKNDRITLIFSPALENDTAEIFVQNLTDISGFDIENFSFQIAKPQEVEYNDLVINELLFHTNEGISTFAELFNASEKVIDLSKIEITRRLNGALDSRKKITEHNILLFPKKYLLLTDNILSVCGAYDCDENALKIECALPSLPNTEGSFVIAKPSAELIDEFNYSEKMHQKFVSNPRGVSLERINPYTPTQDVNNWHSASFDVNYGTPSRQNSQYFVPKIESDKNFWLEYETFTPDNDGYRDFLVLNYALPESGFALSATIYDPTGQKMRTLCNNAVATASGSLIWNGLSDNNSLCPVGVYVIVAEAINVSNGKKIQKKIVCVLSMR
ncbi:MAG: lamin tail domain-containing protein [Prevotellaceae bacterium]|jgi:hypothetical protein|nr:lamin tail domain-containing protein [Prevotellaceae bacterium]